MSEAGVNIPDGMVEVTQEQFFALLKSDPRDIMPSIKHSPYYSVWECYPSYVFGRSYPGWKNPSGKQIYAVDRAALAKASGR